MRQQAVVLKHNKPRPHVAHRGIARFLEIDQKCINTTGSSSIRGIRGLVYKLHRVTAGRGHAANCASHAA